MEKVIIKSIDEIKKQLPDFQKVYPNIKIDIESLTELRLKGTFTLHKEYGKYQTFNDYKVEIVIPISSLKLPYVIDVDRQICPSYPHYYSDGRLCLETDVIILADYVLGFDLLKWMDKYVESYYFTYEYYMRYGEFPYGERKHGLDGIIESYVELLGARNAQECFLIMQYILNNKYRGHNYCPCKSGKKLRNCHGNRILAFYKYENLNDILKKDCNQIMEAILRYERNTKTAK